MGWFRVCELHDGNGSTDTPHGWHNALRNSSTTHVSLCLCRVSFQEMGSINVLPSQKVEVVIIMVVVVFSIGGGWESLPWKTKNLCCSINLLHPLFLHFDSSFSLAWKAWNPTLRMLCSVEAVKRTKRVRRRTKERPTDDVVLSLLLLFGREDRSIAGNDNTSVRPADELVSE